MEFRRASLQNTLDRMIVTRNKQFQQDVYVFSLQPRFVEDYMYMMIGVW